MATPIRVLMWADLLAVYAIWVMMTYLTEVWDLSITHAAGILNIWVGIVLTLPLGLAYLVDTLLGNYKVLALSSIAYSVGLGFLSMSTPSVLSNFTGICSDYKPECIGHTQKGLFYAALALIAIGMSGHIVTLKPFILEQSPTSQNGKRTMLQRPRKREVLIVFFSVVGGIALPYIKPWSIRFGIPAICSLVTTITFLSGSWCYERKGPVPEGSPLTSPFRVILASASKMFGQLSSSPNDLYEEEHMPDRLPHTDKLRCLDKAAMKLPNQERNKWQLCTVTQVEETKMAIWMIPMWLMFIICGLVFSAGNTYFQEQANHLSRKVGKLKVPLPILLLLQEFAKSIFSRICLGLRRSLDKYAPPVGIAAAMIFATLSCITGAKVEARRLDVVRSHGLIEKPEETIPMNIFWVLPQFVLLAGLDAFFENGVKDFFRDQSPTSTAKYFDYFSRGVSGLGYMASVLSAFVVGKISERGGKSNWFQHTINKSRLDNYFWTLSALCAVNLLVYILVACFFPYREPMSGGEAQQGEEQLENEEFDGVYGNGF